MKPFDKKKLLSLLLTPTLILSLLAGCGSDDELIPPVDPDYSEEILIDENQELKLDEEEVLYGEADIEAEPENTDDPDATKELGSSEKPLSDEGDKEPTESKKPTEESQKPSEKPSEKPAKPAAQVSLSSVPAYSGKGYIALNDNVPNFSGENRKHEAFETYSPLDSLGRCGVAYANICKEIMPTGDRGSISEVKPTGWIQHKYDFVSGKSLYNRCHLIGFQLAGENANELNLVTGSRSFNAGNEGMLPFENMVADYVKETGNHVLYRVTPHFVGNELVCRGVQIEAQSVEDNGAGIEFNVYVYNVEPGVHIDYATGENWAEGGAVPEQKPAPQPTQKPVTPPAPVEPAPTPAPVTPAPQPETQGETYVLNTNSKKFHKPGCSSVKTMKPENRQDFTGSRDELISQDYKPCGNCNP